jgi:poly-beta-1,6-N-acetyl-D-glucosamine synthase
MQVLFFCSIFIVLYTYVLYPLLLFIINKKDFQPHSPDNVYLTVIIPAYNEIGIINEKIANTIKIVMHYNYQIIVISNGSNDGTQLLEWDNVLHIKGNKREGKAAAINAAIPFIKGNYVLLTDANTLLNNDALTNMLPYFANANVAMVCGEKRLHSIKNIIPIEKIYWNFESNLKLLESNFNTVIGAAGECILIKKDYLTTLPNNIILDDFWLSTEVLKQQLIIAYANNAIATELESLTIKDEFKRRIRIASGVMQWLMQFGYGAFTKFTLATKWQFFSHRFCRWILSPIALLIAVYSLLNLALFYKNYWYLLLCVSIVILLSTCFNFLKKGNKYTLLPFYFIAVHICMLIGYCKYFTNKHTVLWQKAKR